ncbi:HNH endonuclease [Patescibacteria group bacterium]|nr:HNH endonuclease [Patescibacteria group bacterium]
MSFKFELRKYQGSKIKRDRIISELETVARNNNYTDFRQDDFDKVASISSYTVYREFGSWQNAMNFLVKHLHSKGIDFKLTSRRTSYSDKELFGEMERIWIKIGHQPSKDEWLGSDYKISYDTYPRHFGSWQNACLKFIESKSGNVTVSDDNNKSELTKEVKQVGGMEREYVRSSSDSRTISLSLRLKVLSRDQFRCVFCGKSPATDIGTKLHIDHMIPFSKGGKSTIENLQTLCEECNLGKSNNFIKQ